MEFIAAIIAFTSMAVALPAAEDLVLNRQGLETITDQLLFRITLPQFTGHRNRRNPPDLDWSSDGCTDSPDNPFGFPFLPACHRHDFGYQNYRAQKRFTKGNKVNIDLNFKNDLYFQCQQVLAREACEELANVYYWAVRRFGGRDATMTNEQQEENLDKAYGEALAAYELAVKEAQEQGLLSVLDP